MMASRRERQRQKRAGIVISSGEASRALAVRHPTVSVQTLSYRAPIWLHRPTRKEAGMNDLIDVDGLIDGLIEREGGYVANPADKGGPTCFGITQAVARANGYVGPMRELPRVEA